MSLPATDLLGIYVPFDYIEKRQTLFGLSATMARSPV